jgi:tRNA (guanine37-N1)-methyltransferase
VHNEKRPGVVRAVIEHLREQYRRALGVAAPDDADWDRELDARIRRLPEVRAALNRMWPVLTGGELPALVVIDAVVRLLPGAISEGSPGGDSFADGLLEHPQYTRPDQFAGLAVPDVLLSGHHGEVERWRRRESLRRTLERRPDLLDHAELTDTDRRTLDGLGAPTRDD